MTFVSRFSVNTVLAAWLSASAGALAAPVGENRCLLLEQQTAQLLAAKDTFSALRARKLAVQAHAFCEKEKYAQGLRTYVKALQILGAKPVLPKD